MIKVSCDACGAGFNAKDELAGRRGKCPSCKAPIVVPELDADEDEQEDEDPAPAVASSSRSRRKSAGRRTTSTVRKIHGRKGNKKDARRLVLIIAGVVVVAAVGAWYGMQGGSGASPYSFGIDLMAAARFDEAIAEFDKVEPGNRLYAQAQEQRAAAILQRDSFAAKQATEKSENTYQVILALEKRVTRGGKGHLEPDYVPKTRYLLKRCAQFKRDFPESGHMDEVDAIAWRFSEVASLDDPPTEADVRAELAVRLIMQNPNYKDSLLAVDEFANAWPDQVEAAREMRNEIEAHSREYWVGLRGELQKYLEPGQENWQHVANKCATYIKKIEEAPPLVPAAEARELQQRAIDAQL